MSVKTTVWGDVLNVKGDVLRDVGGNVGGNVYGDVDGTVMSDVIGDVKGHVFGKVFGTIAGRNWTWVETPKDKLKRLVEEGADKELILETLNQLEES